MESFTYTLTNGQTVKIVNPSGTAWVYEVYNTEGELLGEIYTDGNDGTDSPALMPYVDELLKAIYDNNRPSV